MAYNLSEILTRECWNFFGGAKEGKLNAIIFDAIKV